MKKQKTYEFCDRCSKKLWTYTYNNMCGKCYLIYKQEQRKKKGLK